MSFKIVIFICYAIIEIRGFKISELETEVVKSISDAMNRKQIIIVTNLTENKNYKEFLSLLKYFSNYGIYTLFQSANKMNLILMQLVLYGYPTYKYNPRAIAIINNEELPEVAKLYFNEHYDAVVAKIPWISFDTSTEKFTEKMNQSYIPYDCQFLIANRSNNTDYDIHEIYKIYPSHTVFRIARFGSWSVTNDLIVPVNDFYKRRFNFNESIFGIRTSCWTFKGMLLCPYVEQNIFHEIVTSVADRLNFRFYYLYERDNISHYNFFKYHPDSKIEFFLDYVGVFDSAFYKHDRIPVWRIQAYLHVSFIKEYEKGMSSPFIRPFTKRLWLSIEAWIIVSTTIILFINYSINSYKKSSKMFDQLLDSCFVSFEAFTNQCGSGTTIKTDSYRIATFTILIPPLFLVLAYSGTIISFITVRIIQFPFQNLEEFIQDGTFKMGYAKDTFPLVWFQNTKDPIARLAYERFAINEEDIPYIGAGSKKMCDDPKFSFIHFNDVMFEFTYDCQPLQIPVALFTTNIALEMRAFSPFKNIFSRIVNSVRSSGILNGLRKRVYYVDPKTGLLAINTKDFLKSRIIEIDTVDWDAVESLFILLGIAYFISVTILILEHYIYQRMSKKFIFQKSQEKYNTQKNKANFKLKTSKPRPFKIDLKIKDLD